MLKSLQCISRTLQADAKVLSQWTCLPVAPYPRPPTLRSHPCRGRAAAGPPHPRPGSPGFLRSSLQQYPREPPTPPALFKSPPLLFLSATALSNMTHTSVGITILSLLPQRERRLPGARPSHLPSFTALSLASRCLDTGRRCVQSCGPLSL